MIKYTTKDIIDRAEQLSDLQNSDFISDYEKIALLNENWQILYQKLIDTNDKKWVKTIQVRNGMRLPRDFYQLSAIYTQRTKDQITKINSCQQYGYEIKNDTLLLSSDYDNVPVIMEYWTVPKTLFLKEKKKDSPYTGVNIKAVNGSVYLDGDIIRDVYDDSVEIKLDSLTEETETTEVIQYNQNPIIFDNALITYPEVEDNPEGKYCVFSFDTGYPSIASINNFIPFIIDNVLYLYTPEDITTGDNELVIPGHKVIDIRYNEYTDIDLSEIIGDKMPSMIYTNRGFATMYIVYDDEITLVDHSEVIATTRCDSIKGKCYMNGKKLYGVTVSNKLVSVDSDLTIIPTEYTPVTMVNPNLALTHRPLGDRYFLEGVIEDTVLDFGNNIYYVLLSYLLAIAFKSKQNADKTALVEQYNVVESQFFSSLNRDVNENYSIKNVYTNRGYGIWY